MRLAWPDTQIDWLVFESTAAILENNPVADRIITIDDQSSFRSNLSTLKRVFGRYDVSVSVQSGDRPTFFARCAAPAAYSFASQASGGRFRDTLLTGVVYGSKQIHRVDQVLRLTELLKITAHRRVIPPDPTTTLIPELAHEYVVFHPGAAFRYKLLNTQAWRDLYDWYFSRNIQVVVTGGNSEFESNYLDKVFDSRELLRLDGKLSWPQLADLLIGSRMFIGVDTSVTHLAASLGVQTFAIFGPTDPKLWAPIGPPGTENVRVIQAALPCVPCQLEGCERHINSRSDCLEKINASVILEAADTR